MNKNEKIAVGIAVAGALVNIADAFSARGDPRGGYLFGERGVLAPINDRLPIQLGFLLILAGAGMFVYLRYGRK